MNNRIRRLAERFYNPFTPRWLDRSIFDYLQILPGDASVLNVGSGSTQLRDNIINLDIKSFPNVNVLADAHYLPFRDACLDCVFCSAVLEHTTSPWLVAAEIQRTLKMGGIACIQSPFLEAIHDEHDYFRFTLKGLKVLFPKLKEVKSGISGSYSQIFADLLRVYPILVFENTLLNFPMRLIMGWLAKPFQYLDFLVKGKPSMSMYARAFYFVGVKA